jgi:HEAT repeat protein
MIEALLDERQTTDRPESMQLHKSFTMGQVADGAWLLTAFQHVKYPAGVPAFLKWAQEGGGRAVESLAAIGNAGDPGAIPALLAMLKKEELSGDRVGMYECILSSLVKLEAPGARELLFARIFDDETVETVEHLGDAAALPALRKIVADGKGGLTKGSTAEGNRRLVDAARVAIATLEPGDPIPRYCAMLDDPSLVRVHLRAASRILTAKQINPVAIPSLLRTIRTSADGHVASVAIQALGRYRYKSAVAGLIDCFAVDFGKKVLMKTNAEAFEDEIGAVLEKITGKRFGADAAAWRTWWAAEGR